MSRPRRALLALSKALAADYGEADIRVNAILPGWVVTQRQLDTWLTPEAEADWMEQVSLKQRLLPEEVANSSLYFWRQTTAA